MPIFLHAERRSATKTPVRASSVRAEARRLVGRSFGCGHYQKGATRGRAFGALRHHLLPLSKLQVAPKGAESYCDDFAVRRSSRPFAERQNRTVPVRAHISAPFGRWTIAEPGITEGALMSFSKLVLPAVNAAT